MILLITKRPTNADWWKHLGGRTASLDTTRLRCLFGSTASDNMPSGGPDGSVQNLQGITTQQADGSGQHSQAQSNTKNSGSPISSDSPTTILADCSQIFSYAQHDSIPHKWILLDNRATIHLFSTSSLVTNIHPSPNRSI